MAILPWLQKLHAALGWLPHTPSRRKISRCARPFLLVLEDRLLPSAYLVTTTADSGLGSLRDAITQIDLDTSHALYASPSNPSVDEIDFNITAASDAAGGGTGFNAVTGVATITPLTGFNIISNSAVIDGYSQPGASMNNLPNDDNAVLCIVLNGGSLPGTSNNSGFTLSAGNCTVEGLVINNFLGTPVIAGGAAIAITGGSGDHIQGNFLGINADGLTTPLPEAPTDLAGSLPTMYAGVNITAPAYGNWVGTSGDGSGSVAERNIISSCNVGVVLHGPAVADPGLPDGHNVIAGNFIGTNRHGTGWVQDAGGNVASNRIGIGSVLGEHNDLIGGTSGDAINDPTQRNIISGNGFGIVFTAGTSVRASDVLVSDYNMVVAGNYIGTDVTGTQPLGNVGAGVAAVNGTYSCTIGGASAALGNVIAYNGAAIAGPGVAVSNYLGAPATGIQIEGNSIHDNSGLGIDLVDDTSLPFPDGVTPNGSGNGAGIGFGPNNWQYFPTLSSATSSSTSTFVSGAFDWPLEHNLQLTLDFYANSSAIHLYNGQYYGEGEIYLGSRTINLDSTGYASFGADFAIGNLAGAWISATATNDNGSTSEFSADVQATASSQSFADNLAAALPQTPGVNTMVIQADTGTINDVVTGLSTNNLGSNVVPVSVYLNLAPGTYQQQMVNVPAEMTLYINGVLGATIDPDGPAFTVASGNVVASNVTFITTGDAPTILVTGGSLTLRNDIIQESTSYTDSTISVTGGTLDLGTAQDPGGNTLNINGTGSFIDNATGNSIPQVGDTFDVNGAVVGPTFAGFQVPQDYTVSGGTGPFGGSPNTLAVADLNGDGIPDLVVGSSNDNVVSVLLGNGDGTFQTAQTVLTARGDPYFSEQTVAVADVNGDGKPDLIVADYSNNSVSVLLGNGNGTFQAPQSFYTGAGPRSVAVADLNGDGKPDLIVADAPDNPYAPTQNQSVVVLMGNGDGTFQAPRTIQTFSPGSYLTSVTAAELTGDGKPDVIAVSYSGISVLLGNGDGTFRAAQTIQSGGRQSVAVADVNGDGKPDLVLAQYSGDVGSVSVLLGNGDGTFQAAQGISSAAEYGCAVAVADVNGDGKPDVIVANRGGFGSSNANISVFLGNGNGTFEAAQQLDGGGVPVSVAVADLNGDGKPDLIVGNGNSVSIVLGNGNGTFQALPTTPEFATGATPYSMALADLNGDGKADLLVGTTNGLDKFLGNGDGTFQPEQTIDPGVTITSVTVADLSGDGKPDLVVVSNYNTVSVLLGNGDGTFQAPQAVYSSNETNRMSVAVADINGDGKLDLFVNLAGEARFVMLGNGDGTFQSPVDSGYQLPYFGQLAVGDLNGDGQPDFVGQPYAGSGVNVYLNNGDGTFHMSSNIVLNNPTDQTIRGQEGAVKIADVNGDGKPDLLLANGFTGALTVLLGNGDGTFQPLQNFDATTNPSNVVGLLAVGDLNGDGIPDVVITSGNGVNVLLGQPEISSITTVSSSGNISILDQAVTFTATVSAGRPGAGTPTGAVDFFDETTNTDLGSAQVHSGKASLTVSSLANGNHTVIASYGVHGSFLPSSASVTQTVSPDNDLQDAITAQLQTSPSATTVTVQAATSTDADNLLSAVNGLSAQGTPVTVTLNLASGTYSDLQAAPPAGVTLVISGNGSTTTIVGHSPALTVTSGSVVVTGVIFSTATDAPTILVTGGSLTLRNDVVQESTGFTDAAIAVSGGTLNLGTAASPGGNIINVNGAGAFVNNATANAVPTNDDTFQINGSPIAGPSLSFTSLTSSQLAFTAAPARTFAGFNLNSPGGVQVSVEDQRVRSQNAVKQLERNLLMLLALVAWAARW